MQRSGRRGPAAGRGVVQGRQGWKPFASSLTIGLGALGWEKWRVGDPVIHAMYDRVSKTTRTFTVGPEGPEDRKAGQAVKANGPGE